MNQAMRFINFLDVRLLAIIGMFITGIVLMLKDGLNTMNVLFTTAACGAYSLMNIVSSYRKHKSLRIFAKEGVVLGGLLWGMLLFIYILNTETLNENFIVSIVLLFIIGVLAIIIKRVVINK